MENIRKRTLLTRQVRKKVKVVCCVAVPGTILLSFAARRAVTGMGLLSVSTSTGCVSVSAWTDLHFVLCSFTLFSFFFFLLSSERSEDFSDEESAAGNQEGAQKERKARSTPPPPERQ
jgi:hypothetical protein